MAHTMLRVLVLAAASLTFVVSTAAQQKDKDTAKPKPANTTELTAKVVKVDAAKGIITVDDAGTQREFRVTAETKIVGPRGATSKERLKDERFAPGWEMKLTTSADGKKLLQIQLPLRKDKKSDK